MGPQQQFYASLMFENRVRRATGFEYENIFHQVMVLKHPGEFIPIEPYGNLGDRKNDGYIPSKGEFFQVYAPKAPSEKLAAAAEKAKTDFAGLKAYWHAKCPIRHYRFVFKDDFNGSIAPLEAALLELATAHGVKTSPFLTTELRQHFLALSDTEIFQVLHSIVPEPGFLPDADYEAIRDIVEHVMNSSSTFDGVSVLSAPELIEKIRFNKLSPSIEELLVNGSRQANAIDDFFSNRAGFHKQVLRDRLASIYSEEKQTIQDDGDRNDRLFLTVLDRITPPTQRMKRAVRDAALVVMAFYIEACDVFEAPYVDA